MARIEFYDNPDGLVAVEVHEGRADHAVALSKEVFGINIPESPEGQVRY